MNTFKEIKEGVWDCADAWIVAFPEDTAKGIISAMEDFIEELNEVTAESRIKCLYSAAVFSNVTALVASSASDLRRMLSLIKDSNGDLDVNSLRELIYSARIRLQLAGRAVFDHESVLKQTSPYKEIFDCLSAVLVLLTKLVMLHDTHGWVTSSAVYSEN